MLLMLIIDDNVEMLAVEFLYKHCDVFLIKESSYSKVLINDDHGGSIDILRLRNIFRLDYL